MYHHIPTIRRGGSKKVKFRKLGKVEMTDTGIIAEIEIADVDTAEIGIILVSGEILNSPVYAMGMQKDHFTVWEEDIEWLAYDKDGS